MWRAKCTYISAHVLLLEVQDRAARRISATQTTYHHFCKTQVSTIAVPCSEP